MICVPTYLLIGILNSRTGQSSLLALLSRIARIKSEDPVPIRPGRVRSDIGTTTPTPNPSTQRRLSRSLSTYEGLASRSGHAGSHPAVLESKDLKRTFSEPLQQPERVSTVKFNLDTFESDPPPPPRGATALDVSDPPPGLIRPSNTDPGPRNDVSGRGRTLLGGISARFSWDEKKESPV